MMQTAREESSSLPVTIQTTVLSAPDDDCVRASEVPLLATPVTTSTHLSGAEIPACREGKNPNGSWLGAALHAAHSASAHVIAPSSPIRTDHPLRIFAADRYIYYLKRIII